MEKRTNSTIKKGVLLLNLGSPDSPSVKDVRKYLAQFLMDPYVIDAPYFIRLLIVYLTILPKRPKESAHAYQSIWTENGSPLVQISKDVQKKLQDVSNLPIYLAMRYQNPSIPNILKQIEKDKITHLHLIPLYPHYAMSSTKTVVEEVKKHAKNLVITEELPFYKNQNYIDALVQTATPYLNQTPLEHLLFSYHGLPYRHLRKTDPTKTHCQKVKNCCATPSIAHNTCYLKQTIETTNAFIKEAQIDPQKASIAYQSRLGKDPWIEPNTEEELKRLAKNGIKNIHVICPSFVSDCLETLEEIKVRATEVFQEAGGNSLIYIPCLNTEKSWIETLKQMVETFKEKD